MNGRGLLFIIPRNLWPQILLGMGLSMACQKPNLMLGSLKKDQLSYIWATMVISKAPRVSGFQLENF